MSQSRKGLTKEEGLALLEKHRPDFERYEAEKLAREEAEKQRWANEIAMLERRVKEEAEFVDLGHGDTLGIRTCLSDMESGRLGELYQTWFSPLQKTWTEIVDGKPIQKTEEISQKELFRRIKARKEVAFEIIELVTANPMITRDWLKENRDKFATDDVVNAIFTWAELRQKRENERARRLVSAALFRPEPEGSGIRELPVNSGDSRPEGMGGPPG